MAEAAHPRSNREESVSDQFLCKWHRIVAEKDLDALFQILHENVTIGAPPYWNRLEGRPLVHHLLSIIIETIEDFTYYREWQDDRELALEFQGHVEDLDVQGIDLITLGADGRVANIDVLMRPVNTVLRLQEVVGPRMLEYLAQANDASKDRTDTNTT
jgi:hypothetical protein